VVPRARVSGNHDRPVVVDAIDFMGRTYTGDRDTNSSGVSSGGRRCETA
jgi:hypothetical protein